MPLESREQDPLARCHGYAVLADDGWLGEVETPLFGSDSVDPDYLAVRAGSDGRHRVLVPVSLIRRVDTDDRTVYVQGSVWDLAHLPSSLPLLPEAPGPS